MVANLSRPQCVNDDQMILNDMSHFINKISLLKKEDYLIQSGHLFIVSGILQPNLNTPGIKVG